MGLVIGNFSPVSGSTVTAAASIAFDVTDTGGPFVMLSSIEVDFPSGKKELVFAGSAGNSALYSISVAVITDGYRFTLARTPAWPEASFTIDANVADTSPTVVTQNASYTVSNALTTPPSTSGFFPAIGGNVLPTGSVFFFLTSAGGSADITSIALTAALPSGTLETIYSGNPNSGGAFGSNYSAGSLIVSTGPGANTGYSLTIARSGGWPWQTVSLMMSFADFMGNVSNGLYVFNVYDSAPTYGAFAPTSGASVGRNQAVSFEVTTIADLERCWIVAEYASGAAELIYDGAAFAPAFTAGSGAVLSLSNVTTFTLTRSAGWLGSFSLHVFAIDIHGLEQDSASYNLTVTDPPPGPDVTAPVVSNTNPLAGTPIAPGQPVSFQVTDNSGVFRRIIINAAYPTGVVECVHDGDGFRGFYSLNSTRVAITGGFAYSLLRAGGWPGAPTITVFAIDIAGNEAST